MKKVRQLLDGYVMHVKALLDIPRNKKYKIGSATKSSVDDQDDYENRAISHMQRKLKKAGKRFGTLQNISYLYI